MTKYYRAMYKPIADAGGNLNNTTYSSWQTTNAPFNFSPVTAGTVICGYQVWDDTPYTVFNPAVMPTVQAVGTAVTSASTAAITIVPPAHVANDMLVAVLAQRQNQTVPDLFGLYGWNILGTYGGTSSSHQKITIAWKRATGTNSEGNLSYQPAAGSRAGVILNIRGVNTGLAPVMLGGNFTNTATTSVSVNGGVTTTDQCLILQGFVTNQTVGLGDIASGQTNATLTGLVNQVEVGGSGTALYVTTGGISVAGTVDPLTATLSTAASFAGASVAFLPV